MQFLINRFGSNGFEGEHLWLGHLGHFFIVFGFFLALLSAVSYYFAEVKKEDSPTWQKIARWSFHLHGAMVIGVFVLLFIMILNHWFEYHYAWRHSSLDLPLKYVISSFWEGQEGSFLLWEFWIVILGWVLIYTAKHWENPVMFIVAVTQSFLGSMVLGVYVFGYKIGSNPFILLRHEMAQAPIFQQPTYLSMIEDGNGLNPLLQNYWMTIHPPVLFLGFASVLIPFAFVMASLWRGDYKGWVKPALPWSLFSIAIFGTGILMGGAWAYESLSFGGFWAWDPVENMSFVPWLLVLAGLHLHVVYKHTGHSLLATYIFYALGWLMVLYSTFLTRSGILGDTSVHAFTDLGMSGQLLVYAGAYLFPAIILIAIRYSSMPKQEKEEPLLSREFWMFIGALIMLLSAVQMTFTTSIPVWNKLFGLELAPPADVIAHYNNVQIWIALLAAMGSGFVLFLSYKTNRFSSFIKFVLISLVLSLIFGFLIAYGTEIEYIAYFGEHKIPFVSPYFLLLITSLFAAFAALFYMIFVIKGRVNNIGGSVSHFGFGIFLVGVLISQYKMHVVSLNNEGVNFGEGFEGKEMYENILLVRDSVYEMGGYQVVYSKRESSKISNVYQVDYKKTIGTKVVEQFSLSPYVILNERMGNSSNPSTKHYWDKDVFTHVVAASDLSTEKDSASIVSLALGDTTYLNRSMIVFESIDPKPKLDNQHEGMLAVKANLKIKDLKGLNESASPVFLINQKSSNEVSTIPYENKTLGIYVDIKKIDPDTKKFTFSVKEKNLQNDFIIMKAIVFPYINLVWLGGILTFLGALMSMWYRRKN